MVGTYDVTDVIGLGGIAEITFVDSVNYTSLTGSDTDEQDSHQGTYVLDLDGGTLTLTDSVTGAQVLPFQIGSLSDGGTVTTSNEELHLLGGSLGGSASKLGNGPATVKPACNFTAGGNTFQSTTTPACGTLSSKAATALTSGPDGGVCLGGGCCQWIYPSGVHLQTVANAGVTAAYAAHLTTPPFPLPNAPQCFIDMHNIIDATTNLKLTSSVQLSAHYTLQNVVYGGAGNMYDEFVVVDPLAVAALEKFAASAGGATVYSAFRGPQHQASVCQGYCGAISCTDASGRTTCAKASQHMFGDAFDLTDPKFLTVQYQKLACASGFKYAYNESVGGVRHLHMDTWGRGNSPCLLQTN